MGLSKSIYPKTFWYISISFAFTSKYLLSASAFAFDISNALFIFSRFLYLSKFLIADSFVLSTEIIKLIILFCPPPNFIVFLSATIGSVTSPNFLENGSDFSIATGIFKFPLSFNLSLSISNSLSTIVSQSVKNAVSK